MHVTVILICHLLYIIYRVFTGCGCTWHRCSILMHSSCLSFLAADRTSRLWVFKEVHLPCTSFLESIFETVYGLSVNISLVTIYSIYWWSSGKRSTNVNRSDNASSPISKCALWLKCLRPFWKNVTKEWKTLSFDSHLRFLYRMRSFGDLATFSVDFLHFIGWMSAIFLLPVCLTYWPRKYTTYINPHSDNSHQVWSSTVELKCSVWWCVTWPCDLTFDLLTLNSCYTWWVTCPLSNPATKFEDPSLILSWVISYNVFHWIPLTLRFFATAHAPYHVTCA